MKRVLFHTVFAVVALIAFTACATRQTAIEKEVTATDIRIALEKGEFRFIPNQTQRHYVCVSAGIVNAYLPGIVPYRGLRPFPITSREDAPSLVGISRSFTYTDFEYSVTPGRRAGRWFVRITPTMFSGGIVYVLEVREDGRATFSREFHGLQGQFRRPDILQSHRGRIEIIESNALAVNDIASSDD